MFIANEAFGPSGATYHETNCLNLTAHTPPPFIVLALVGILLTYCWSTPDARRWAGRLHHSRNSRNRFLSIRCRQLDLAAY
jgi:hypothetical protein